ncbi:MAG: Unknown protein [uncultured Thiotrichaceae bacterium]|uniref:YCII-related domain-containing protein n=1 Tax=uncultured Thiotrichaceae bacterium TaxID=298394 RepID=A0A6S6S9R1_9GAMM|nr:MAG: Unknown protein [uncultured Thiotrichaceae bacterium]
MAHYLLAYIGGEHPTSPSEQQKHFEKYTEWLTSLSESILVPTLPLKDTVTVNPDGTFTQGTTTAMSGYTILDLASMDEALDAAKSCPFLEIGGTLEVSELMQMPTS